MMELHVSATEVCAMLRKDCSHPRFPKYDSSTREDLAMEAISVFGAHSVCKCC